MLAQRASRVRSRPMEPGQAAPLALNGACRRGPRSPPRHRRSPRPRRRRACGRHDGEVVRGERTGDAVRDGGTHRSLPRQRRGKLRVQGGAASPWPDRNVSHCVGWLMALSLRPRCRDGGWKRTRRGLLAPGGCVPSELPVKALVGSPEHHESGLGSNAVEGTDQQRLPLDDRLLCLAAGSRRR